MSLILPQVSLCARGRRRGEGKGSCKLGGSKNVGSGVLFSPLSLSLSLRLSVSAAGVGADAGAGADLKRKEGRKEREREGGEMSETGPSPSHSPLLFCPHIWVDLARFSLQLLFSRLSSVRYDVSAGGTGGKYLHSAHF